MEIKLLVANTHNMFANLLENEWKLCSTYFFTDFIYNKRDTLINFNVDVTIIRVNNITKVVELVVITNGVETVKYMNSHEEAAAYITDSRDLITFYLRFGWGFCKDDCKIYLEHIENMPSHLRMISSIPGHGPKICNDLRTSYGDAIHESIPQWVYYSGLHSGMLIK